MNQSLVNANLAGQTLTVGGVVSNLGTMEATNGGLLSILGSIDNAGGTVLAAAGTVSLAGPIAQLSGGTLTGGTWIAQGGSPLYLAWNNNITTNRAKVVLAGAGANIYQFVEPPGVYTNYSLINNLANNQGSFSLLNGQSFSTTGSLANSGTIDVDAASSLTIAGSYSPQPGSLTIADGKLAFSGTMNVLGALNGSGTVNGSVNVAGGGILAPGDAPGTLTIAGNLLLAGSANYLWEIGSASADLTHVTGNLGFGQTEILDVALFGTSMPVAGDYPLFVVDGSIRPLPTWTINLPAGWTSGGIVQSGNEVLLTDLHPVPEPSTLALVAAAAIALLHRLARSQRRRRTRS